MPEYQPKAFVRDLIPSEKHKIPLEKKNITEYNTLRFFKGSPGPANYMNHTVWYDEKLLFNRPTFNKFTRVTIASDILKRGLKKEFNTPGP